MHTYKGININYKLEGEYGQYILFLHGWGGNIDSFSCLTRYLKNSYRCLSIDFPPFGSSDEPTETWDVKEYSEMVLSVLKSLNIKKTHIISHSFGGRVAIFLSGKYNHIVDKLVLIDSAGIRPRRGIIYYYKIFRYKLLKKINSKKANNCGSLDYRLLSPSMKKTFSKIVNEDLSESCKFINCETLIIFGKKDESTPIYMAKKLNKLIKNSQLVIYKKCGHFSYVEDLNKTINVLTYFLRS